MHISRDDLIDYLANTLNVDVTGLDDDSPLFSSGHIDSFAMIDLISHLEGVGGARIDAADITLDNFDTIGRILVFVQSKAG